MDAHDYLKRAYARMVVPDEDGSYFAEIVEFPGCFATGQSAVDALSNLDDVAVDWINTAIAQGQNIPDPMDAADYSGKLVLRMPKGLHKRAALWAEREGVSLNQLITTCLAEALGERARPSRVAAEVSHSGVAYQTIRVATASVSMQQPLGNHLVLNQLFAANGSSVAKLPIAIWQHQRDQERRHG
ncbi:toxin-antitoxin system HicB family antitoxin [Bradyrhizobium sp. LLZ17]|uniref:Toxin-antitoxin system HicB family antitoxin n=1 Tax=Bradyrhizobium sp. LLZ17 TaxID=3239388 RepID=A0AB39XR51_9BRAD